VPGLDPRVRREPESLVQRDRATVADFQVGRVVADGLQRGRNQRTKGSSASAVASMRATAGASPVRMVRGIASPDDASR
jgi:hypothetical protein